MIIYNSALARAKAVPYNNSNKSMQYNIYHTNNTIQYTRRYTISILYNTVLYNALVYYTMQYRQH